MELKLYTIDELIEEENKKNLEYQEKYLKIYAEEAEEIVHQYRTWAIVPSGIDCLTDYYPIQKERLPENWNWILAMAEKGWVEMNDFLHCFEAAQRYFHPSIYGTQNRRGVVDKKVELVAPKRKPISSQLRFEVLKRDNYKCGICGSSAKDGVKLEIDHKVPVFKGGKNHINNLWTLCWDCNRGKGIKEI